VIVDRRAAQKDDLRNRLGLAKLRRPLDTPVTMPRLTWSWTPPRQGQDWSRNLWAVR